MPEDCLVVRIRAPTADFSRRRTSGNRCNYYYYNNHVETCRNPVTLPDPRKRLLAGDDSRVARSTGLEKVTILWRGQSLDSPVKSDVYAGSAFAMSPSPTALPLPSFPTKKQASAEVDDSATRDLRRLLLLE